MSYTEIQPNLKILQEGKKLTIVIADTNLIVYETEKSLMVASSKGNQPITTKKGILKLGINAYYSKTV